MQWHDPYYIKTHGAPSRHIIDINDPSTYAPAPDTNVRVPAPNAVSPFGKSSPTPADFNPSDHRVDAATVAGEVHDSVRVAAHYAMGRLGLKSLHVRWFEGSAAPTIAGATRASDGDDVIWLSNKLTAEQAASACVHEAAHTRDNQGIAELHASGRFADSCVVDEVSERRASDLEQKMMPMVRVALRQYAAAGFPWRGGYANRELRI